MKQWEKGMKQEKERVEQEYKETLATAEQDWINFKNTGECTRIVCIDCPLNYKKCMNMGKKARIKELNKEVEE